MSDFKIYRGVVVDNKDPEKYGRVRVKLFGLNENEAIDNLPWAEVVQPNGFGLIGGVGLSAVLKQGTWVFVVFEEDNEQKQIVLGVATGITELRKDGYADPDQKFPLQSVLGMSDFGQTNINDFSLDNKGLTDTTMTSHGVMFNYQSSVSEDSYVDSWILRSEKGIMVEIDDRQSLLKITHPEGTYIEIKEDGSVKLSASNNITLNTKKDLEFNVLGDFKVNVDGDLKWDILGNFNIFCDNSLNWNVSQNVNLKAKDINLNSQNYTVNSVSVKFSSSDSFKTNTGRLSIHSQNGVIKGSNIITQEKLNLNTHRHKKVSKPVKPS